MSKEQYVSFEVSKLLKEKGFDWDCYAHYNLVEQAFEEYSVTVISHTNKNSTLGPFWISAPTQQMAMDWLRHKGFHVQVIYDVVLKWAVEIVSLTETVQYDYEEAKMYHPSKQAGFDKYEDAAEVGIKYVLENLI